jgi:hypothetical protein
MNGFYRPFKIFGVKASVTRGRRIAQLFYHKSAGGVSRVVAAHAVGNGKETGCCYPAFKDRGDVFLSAASGESRAGSSGFAGD